MEQALILIGGLLIGSFINVLIYRIPRHQSIVFPASHCPRCEHPIPWYLNIPLWGFLIQKGRCRHCQSAISIQYPVVEALTALCAFLLYQECGLSIVYMKMFVFFILLITISVIDWHNHTIPNSLIIFGIISGGVINILSGEVKAAFTGFFVAGGVVWMIWLISQAIYKREAIGGGDVKLVAMTGIFLYSRSALMTLFVAFCLIALFGWTGMILRRIRRDTEIPMAPFFAVAAWGVFLYGEILWHSYLNLLMRR